MATQAPHESDGRVVYKGTCRHLPADARRGAAAMRMMVPEAGQGIRTFTDGHYGTQTVDLTTQCGDFIVRRKDGAWAYQLAVVVDDALMGVTEVVRGRDLLLSSPQQIYTAGCLGFTLRASPTCHCCATPPGSGCRSVTKASTWHRYAGVTPPKRLSVSLPTPPVCCPKPPP